jgi:apolipoprotein D and lipocalin family protein
MTTLFAPLLLTLALGQAPDTAPVDLARYVGTWHELARFDTFFQKGCVASSATYAVKPDGDLQVVNRCRQDTPDGKLKEIEGKAWVADPKVPGKLTVQFFWPFSGPYWILEVAPDYAWALVGHPDKSRCWIFSRTPRVEEPLYQELVGKLKARGYDVAKLVRDPTSL